MVVDAQGERYRLARDEPCDHYGRTELPERAGEGEHPTGPKSARGQRE